MYLISLSVVTVALSCTVSYKAKKKFGDIFSFFGTMHEAAAWLSG